MRTSKRDIHLLLLNRCLFWINQYYLIWTNSRFMECCWVCSDFWRITVHVFKKQPNGKKGITTMCYSFSFCYIILLDRKSTRLNSSHVAISYAAFCLKQKKNT